MNMLDDKIILVTVLEKNQYTNKDEIIVSHGLGNNTLEPHILPCEHPERLGGVWDVELQEWVIVIDPMDYWGRLAK